MKLTKWEIKFLNYYLNNFNAKWMRVFNNKHPLLETRVDLFNIYKMKLKGQPVVGQETLTSMFKQLKEGEMYLITDLLKQDKEDNIV
jgi:hypothetical protein